LNPLLLQEYHRIHNILILQFSSVSPVRSTTAWNRLELEESFAGISFPVLSAGLRATPGTFQVMLPGEIVDKNK
jgi:hypothetical protein